jgi:hypothetical protein
MLARLDVAAGMSNTTLKRVGVAVVGVQTRLEVELASMLKTGTPSNLAVDPRWNISGSGDDDIYLALVHASNSARSHAGATLAAAGTLAMAPLIISPNQIDALVQLHSIVTGLQIGGVQLGCSGDSTLPDLLLGLEIRDQQRAIAALPPPAQLAHIATTNAANAAQLQFPATVGAVAGLV